MASVKEKSSKTQAQEMLEFALGQKRIYFEDLSEAEGNELLKSVLREVPLRELRGFKPLRELLTFRPNSCTNVEYHTLDLEMLDLSPDITLLANGFEENSPVNLDTHVISVSRGWRNMVTVFKRNESGEETKSRKVASSWGRSAYHHRGSGEVLTLRRPRNHGQGDENLITVYFWYEKVPLEKRHIITRIELYPLALKDFRQYFDSSYVRDFDSSYVRAAIEVIWELASAYRRTADELAFQLDSMRKKVKEIERLSDALSFR